MPTAPTPHRLLRATAPFVHLLALKPGETPDRVLQPPSSLLKLTVDGRRTKTKAALLEALAKAFAFPDYFDPNWDALEECLSDLEWLEADGYLLLIRQADELLSEEPDERPTLLAILRSTGKYWATHEPPRPFHTVLARGGPPTTPSKTWRIPAWKGQ